MKNLWKAHILRWNAPLLLILNPRSSGGPLAMGSACSEARFASFSLLLLCHPEWFYWIYFLSLLLILSNIVLLEAELSPLISLDLPVGSSETPFATSRPSSLKGRIWDQDHQEQNTNSHKDRLISGFNSLERKERLNYYHCNFRFRSSLCLLKWHSGVEWMK